MHKFNTEILKPTEINIAKVVDSLKNDEVVAIPTETVYGLSANAFSESAVKKIFEAKGRPQDNPLIVHISDVNQLDNLILNRPKLTDKLISLYWPGPLTLIFEKSDLIPDIISASLNTVAIRFPSHPVARMIIEKAGFALAAPSANISGSPSPTTANHVYNDLKGKIPYIVDGGTSDIGLESTVLSLVGDNPTLLRPGKITIEELKKNIGNLKIDSRILKETHKDENVHSPGMKYKHYAPKAEVKIFEGSSRDYSDYINNLEKKEDVWALCFDEDIEYLKSPYISYGKKQDYKEQAHNFFSSLRLLDEKNAKLIIAHGPKKEGVGLSIYNRLLRSANFNVIKLAVNKISNKTISKEKYLIGLTGQTGAGKTTVANTLKDYGYGVIDADVVSKRVTSNKPCLEKIVTHFGATVLNEDGSLNRKTLAGIVFNDGEKLELLNKITHPFIVEEILKEIKEIDNQIVVIDAATLIESGLYKNCHFIVVIVAPVETRVQRIVKRDKIEYKLAQERILAQNKEYFYTKKADIVIDNQKRGNPSIQTKATHLANYIKNKFVTPLWD